VAKFFERSVHYDKLGCSDCHGKHRITVFEIYTKKLSISDICAGCHTEEGNNYKNSIHYLALKKGANDAPSCVDCHSEHHVLSSETEGSPVYYKNVPKTCAQCHENKAITDKYGISPRRLSSYLSSYHGIFLEKGIPYVANCISCHTPHFILPAEDKRSSIHPDNLPKTCSKCHPKADFSVTKGKIHIEVKPQSAPHVFAVRVFYIIFISILVSGFVIHIIFDFIKFIKNRRSHE
jgi:predicted CXXCH cytochrome family protein